MSKRSSAQKDVGGKKAKLAEETSGSSSTSLIPLMLPPPAQLPLSEPRLLSDPRFMAARGLLAKPTVKDCEQGVQILEVLLSSMVDGNGGEEEVEGGEKPPIEERVETAGGYYEYGRGLYRCCVVRGYELEDSEKLSNSGNGNGNGNGNGSSNSNGNSSSAPPPSSNTAERSDEEDLGIAKEMISHAWSLLDEYLQVIE